MFTVEDIRNKYDELDKLFNINTTNIPIIITKRMTTTYGLCKYTRNRVTKQVTVKNITISHRVMAAGKDIFNAIIAHEYCHAAAILLTGADHGHDRYFKSLCDKCGAVSSRTGDYDDIATPIRRNKRYEVKCTNCNRTFYLGGNSTTVRILTGKIKGYCTCPCGSRKLIIIH